MLLVNLVLYAVACAPFCSSFVNTLRKKGVGKSFLTVCV